jgi:NitT/TauT family transport system substrate-binding protein
MFLPARLHAAEPIRIGCFPNITHSHALLGKALGTFEKQTGQKIDWKHFNAGPSAMEALLAGQLDFAYVGPNPAVNAFMRSKGKALKIIAGAAHGGAALVVHADSPIQTSADLKGKKIAAPELGNTQDIALRHWLKTQGFRPGKDLQLVSAKNPEIFIFFQRKQVAAAWVPEPWLSRLLQEAGGRILIDEKSLWPDGKFPTAVLVVRNEYLLKNPAIVKQILKGHLEAEAVFYRNPDKAKKIINQQLAAMLGKPLPEKILDAGFTRVKLTHDPLATQILSSAQHASDLGYLPRETVYSLSRLKELFELAPLNELLSAQRKPSIR